jgi:hypothetical protein
VGKGFYSAKGKVEAGLFHAKFKDKSRRFCVPEYFGGWGHPPIGKKNEKFVED